MHTGYFQPLLLITSLAQLLLSEISHPQINTPQVLIPARAPGRVVRRVNFLWIYLLSFGSESLSVIFKIM
jgi:hypothetical protein